jgi:hypothetical protein
MDLTALKDEERPSARARHQEEEATATNIGDDAFTPAPLPIANVLGTTHAINSAKLSVDLVWRFAFGDRTRHIEPVAVPQQIHRHVLNKLSSRCHDQHKDSSKKVWWLLGTTTKAIL